MTQTDQTSNPLREKLQSSIKDAMRARDQGRLDTLRFAFSEIRNKEIDLKRELNEDEVVKHLQKMVDQLEVALKQFQEGNREDLVEANQAQIKILQEFLPTLLSEQELEPLLAEFLSTQSTKEFKELIRPAIAQFGAQANGKVISSVLQKLLN